MGQVVPSQAYIDDEDENNTDDFVGDVVDDEVVRNSEDGDGEAV